MRCFVFFATVFQAFLSRFDKFAPNGSNCFIDFNGDGEADTIDQAVSQNDAWFQIDVVVVLVLVEFQF